VEVIVIDDGSEDGTRQVLEESTRGRSAHHLVLRGQPSNPGCTRNQGVALASGDPIFFLDADDLFLDNHLHECLKVFKTRGTVDFVKTQVALSDPVHPDWVPRITNSLVTNLAVRRSCHDLVGGFPDFHLVRRTGDRFEPHLDVFRMIEDVFYNKKITSLCQGRTVGLPTVKHVRHPGNPFDRQYDRFQVPPGEIPYQPDEWYNLRVEIAKVLIDHQIESIKTRSAR
jgi:glycosyltransferase involved in cell wall biosynthesis